MRDEVRIYVDCHAGHNTESWGHDAGRARGPAWLKAAPGRHAAATKSANEARDVFQPGPGKWSPAGFDAMKFDIDSIVVLDGEKS